MLVRRTETTIELDGHAGSIPCAMATALTVALSQSLTEFLHEDADRVELSNGRFRLRIDGLGHDALLLVNAFWFSFRNLCNDYPDKFTIQCDASV